MPTNKLKNVGRTPNPCMLAWTRCISAHYGCARGLVFYVCVLAVVSVFLAININSNKRVYEAGEIADTDIVADRPIAVMDKAATEARRRRVMDAQPQVFDFSLDPYIDFETWLIALMNEVNGVQPKPGQPPASERFAAEIGADLASDVLPQFGLSSTQSFILMEALPLLRRELTKGLVSDARMARVPTGVVIRNLETGQESLLPDMRVLPDSQSLLTEVSNKARADKNLSHDARRAINILLAASMPPTLTLNREATQRRRSTAAVHTEPVTYQLQRGEVIARRGDRITPEQQLIIQNLSERAVMPFNWQQALGSFLVMLFMSLGLFMSPSGKSGSVIHTKDLVLIGVVILLTAGSAKGLHLINSLAASPSLGDAISLAFPLAGAVGFVATVFSARRYVTLGLLLTMIATLAMQFDLYFALFHFLSCMMATWLVSNAVSRQDAVWNLLPVIVCNVLLITGLALINNTSWVMLPMLITAVCINAVLMLILFFSLSPVLEALFGYSTRFRLMEYTNLEQPLLQDIMVTIPGTYHHSLVVANMVEAGAKAIGANSLLCKVAALYHDCGKLVYPQYFVENQFGAPNKHDKLSPSMSALIIISHVKKGVEICKGYGLGKEITDIVAQHHGDRVMRYFYQKAENLGLEPMETDFRYPGPKPQTREAVILMLADSVEASSRTLVDPTPARLKAHIRKIIKGILDEGQLSEADVTFKDLKLLAEAFQKVLIGIFHHRVVYPEAKKDPGVQQAINDLMPSTHPLASAATAIPPLPAPADAEENKAGSEQDAAAASPQAQYSAESVPQTLPAAAGSDDSSSDAGRPEGETLPQQEENPLDAVSHTGEEERTDDSQAKEGQGDEALLLTQPAAAPYTASEEAVRAASEVMADKMLCGPLSRDHPARQADASGSLSPAPCPAADSTPSSGKKPGFWSRLFGRSGHGSAGPGDSEAEKG